MEPARASGRCLCGGVRYEVRGPLRDVVVCHCGRCRRTHGHAAAYTACDRSHLALLEDAALRWYEADGRARGFCGTCGASLFWSAADRDTVSIAAGTLDPPTGLKTVAHVYTRDQGDYYEIGGDGERFAGAAPHFFTGGGGLSSGLEA
jgi:hypothetical protein